MINTTTALPHSSCRFRPAENCGPCPLLTMELSGTQCINLSFHPGDTGVTPPCFDYLCHVLQGDFILKMNTNTVHFRVGICILIIQTMQMTTGLESITLQYSLHLWSGETPQYLYFRCVTHFFQKFLRCCITWRSLTFVHSENSDYSNPHRDSPSALLKHFETNRIYLRMRIWVSKQPALYN